MTVLVPLDRILRPGDGLRTDHGPDDLIVPQDGTSHVHSPGAATRRGRLTDAAFLAPRSNTVIAATLDRRGESVFIEPHDEATEQTEIIIEADNVVGPTGEPQ